mgnify:CR=1 FL=1
MQHAARNYAIVTTAYWGFTLTDGALRMLVLLHFNQLGYTPVQLAFLFLLYEFFGIVTNLVGQLNDGASSSAEPQPPAPPAILDSTWVAYEIAGAAVLPRTTPSARSSRRCAWRGRRRRGGGPSAAGR